MFTEWITTDLHTIVMVIASTAAIYAIILGLTRLMGLRSFSKMSASDFAVTLAIGSVFAATLTSPKPALLTGLTALASLYFFKWLLATLKMKLDWFSKIMDNEPKLLMAGGTFLDDNLERARVTREDVFAKLREANAFNYDQVRAVILETTGDISVIHTSDTAAELEPDFFEQVQGSEKLFDS